MSLFNFLKSGDLPWITKGKEVFGLHETRDKARLQTWLVSDGKTLGDPSALPWCGDFVETAIKTSLPKETLSGDLAANPYWARNWLQFGTATTPVYGAVVVFERAGGGGHVGFLVGEDRSHYYVLGGNQSNAVNISRIEKSRALGYRWPASGNYKKKALPLMSSINIPTTTNEF